MTNPTTPLMAELSRRWREIFERLASGDDLPPTERLRAEGMMEAALLTGEANRQTITQAMDNCYRDAAGSSIAETFGDDWQVFFPFPQIPAMMQRAPVYPSTSD